jgi:hypothetical protein
MEALAMSMLQGYPEKLIFWSMKLNVLQYVLLYPTACN